MYLLREDFNISYPTIGLKLGGRDHTTVIHSCEKIKREVVVDNDLLKEIQNIRHLTCMTITTILSTSFILKKKSGIQLTYSSFRLSPLFTPLIETV